MPSPELKEVLIVEDNEDNSLLAEKILKYYMHITDQIFFATTIYTA